MNIVIIDDNQMNVSLLTHLVKRVDDGRTIGFTDPRAGLDWCLHHDPDLVMVDDRMPELSGLEFIRQFRAGASDNVPVLMLTAPTERALRDRALAVGVTDFIGKPIDRTEFLSRTRSMLALRRFQKALTERTDALTDQVRDANAELAARELAIVRRLAEAAETRNPAARGRLARIADYTEIIARGLLLNPAEQRLLREAAPLHDIGCITVPETVLAHPGPLGDAERALVETHAGAGHKLLGGARSAVLRAAADIALHHHERWDGSGYPQGLRAESIPLHARIVAVADVFDALTSDRPYRAAWPVDDAIDYLRAQAGTLFDPACIAALVADRRALAGVRIRHTDA
ncbi:putative two-component system response regulator [Plasticicumulans lactativorans]|uniref:Putative two-component system response regulator n=1 Tax=Plasticicumulans lactativorans TaxID=1133106 RepID=A0A4R2L9H0_9GAMM|nr:HD domain-containing phosphohydrolase [Plasticicumulans lactativorans]TCO83421.1 putative two-component system response regulator [Plasticicumulans lactativorans]